MTARIHEFACLPLLCIIIFCCPAFGAETVHFQSGLDYYNQKDFKNAAIHFEKHVAYARPDARSIYYLALSSLQSGGTARAKQLFRYLVKAFPRSREAALSRSALERLGEKSPDGDGQEAEPKSDKTDSASSHAEAVKEKSPHDDDGRRVLSHEQYDKEYEGLPEEGRIPVHYTMEVWQFDAEIDGRPIKMKFGSDWETKLGLNDLARARITPPEGKPTDRETIRAGLDIPVWRTAKTIKAGNVTRKVPVTIYQEKSGGPELGRAFTEDLKYEFDQTRTDMVLRKFSGKEQISKSEKKMGYDKEFATLPDKVEIPFQHGSGGHMIVDAQVNGRPIKCMFDTGASAFFGIEQIRRVGITPPTGKPDGYTRGWAGRPVETWNTTAMIKLGNMTRKIPLTIAKEGVSLPLVGQQFIQGYEYSIDRGASKLVLHKKGTKRKTDYDDEKIHELYDIPCRVEGKREYVTVSINNRPCEMLIDTGAGDTIISEQSARSMGMEIPLNAPTRIGVGVGGTVEYKVVYVTIRLGPATRNEFPVSIGGKAGNAIGQDFMSGWRFTVDRERKLLRFFH